MQHAQSISMVFARLAGLALVAAAPAASAALAVSGDCFATYTWTTVAPPFTTPSTTTNSRSCGPLTVAEPSPGVWYGGGVELSFSKASYKARADYGRLGIDVVGNSTSLSFGTSSGAASASAEAAASFEDLVRIGGPAGATVTVQVDLAMSLNAYGNSPLLNSGPDVSALAQLSFFDAVSLEPLKLIQFGGVSDSGSFGGPPSSFYRFELPVGRDIRLLGSVSGNTAVSYERRGYSQVLLGTTISVLTPGATLVAASGHNYAPIPEPSSYALMLLGAVALVPMLARRRKARGL